MPNPDDVIERLGAVRFRVSNARKHGDAQWLGAFDCLAIDDAIALLKQSQWVSFDDKSPPDSKVFVELCVANDWHSHSAHDVTYAEYATARSRKEGWTHWRYTAPPNQDKE